MSESNFETPFAAATTVETTYLWSVKELNTFLTEDMALEINKAHELDVRIVSDSEQTQLISVIVTAYGLEPLPRLAVPGNHQGWNPSEDEADYVPYLATSLDQGATNYEGYLWLDGEFKLVGPDDSGAFKWGNTDWGDNGAFSGQLAVDDESNINAASANLYFLTADIDALTYSLTSVNWGIIGAATPTGWDADTDLIYNASTHVLEVDIDLTPGDLKFRGNNEWGAFDLGTIDEDGFLQNGGNITFDGEAANYHVVLDLSNPRRYKVSFVKN